MDGAILAQAGEARNFADDGSDHPLPSQKLAQASAHPWRKKQGVTEMRSFQQ
jgi:hypothetical protein